MQDQGVVDLTYSLALISPTEIFEGNLECCLVALNLQMCCLAAYMSKEYQECTYDVPLLPVRQGLRL